MANNCICQELLWFGHFWLLLLEIEIEKYSQTNSKFYSLCIK